MENKYVKTALLAADWMLNNHNVEDQPGVDNFFVNNDANYGRYLVNYRLSTKVFHYSGSWTTAAGIMAALSAYLQTKDRKYLESALKAGRYLKSLQILDERNSRVFGAIREETPLTKYLWPRDAMTAAWGFLALYKFTREEDYLCRVKVFIDWFFKNDLDKNGWPYWTFYIDEKKVDPWEGSFQAGALGFLYHTYCVTKDRKYIGKEFRRIADRMVDCFQAKDGSHRVLFNPKTGKFDDIKQEAENSIRHKYNDDFLYTGLLCAWKALENDKYLNSALRYADWLIKAQEDDGGFFSPRAVSAAGTALNLFIEIYKITKDKKYLGPMKKAAEYMCNLQFTGKSIRKAYGGLRGEDNGDLDFIVLRITSYAIITLLKYANLGNGREFPFFSVDGWKTKTK